MLFGLVLFQDTDILLKTCAYALEEGNDISLLDDFQFSFTSRSVKVRRQYETVFAFSHICLCVTAT